MTDSLQADWLSMQYDSFQRFFSKENPPLEISLKSIIDESKSWSPLLIDNWDITAPPNNPSDCIVTNQSCVRKLSFTTLYRGETKIKEKTQTVTIPSPTHYGEFILQSNGIKANRYLGTIKPKPTLCYFISIFL